MTGFSFTVGADVAAVIADGVIFGGAEAPSSGVIGVKTVSSLISILLGLQYQKVLNRHHFRFFGLELGVDAGNTIVGGLLNLLKPLITLILGDLLVFL